MMTAPVASQPLGGAGKVACSVANRKRCLRDSRPRGLTLPGWQGSAITYSRCSGLTLGWVRVRLRGANDAVYGARLCGRDDAWRGGAWLLRSVTKAAMARPRIGRLRGNTAALGRISASYTSLLTGDSYFTTISRGRCHGVSYSVTRQGLFAGFFTILLGDRLGGHHDA